MKKKKKKKKPSLMGMYTYAVKEGGKTVLVLAELHR